MIQKPEEHNNEEIYTVYLNRKTSRNVPPQFIFSPPQEQEIKIDYEMQIEFLRKKLENGKEEYRKLKKMLQEVERAEILENEIKWMKSPDYKPDHFSGDFDEDTYIIRNNSQDIVETQPEPPKEKKNLLSKFPKLIHKDHKNQKKRALKYPWAISTIDSPYQGKEDFLNFTKGAVILVEEIDKSKGMGRGSLFHEKTSSGIFLLAHVQLRTSLPSLEN